MRSDVWPISNVYEEFTAVRKAKSGKRRKNLQRLEPYVFRRYFLFWLHLQTPENVAAQEWSDLSSEALIHCYSSQTQTSSALLAALEQATRPAPFRCPYCLMRQPKTWDHFLAKEDFPEFASLTRNLIRACSTCNTNKLRTFTNAPRRAINPYSDPIPEEPLLWCDAAIDLNGELSLNYYIFRDPNVPVEILDLFERHFSAFKLKADMTLEGAIIVDTFIQELLAYRPAPITAMQLEEEIRRKIAGFVNYPVNSWESATFDGLLRCVNLTGYVNAKRVPAALGVPRVDREARRAAIRAAAAA